MDVFSISSSHEASNDHHGGLYLALQMHLKKVRGADYQQKIADSFKYADVIQKALKGEDRGNSRNILLGMHMQLVVQMKALEKSGLLSTGHGLRSNLDKGSCRDKFILSRNLNLPELVFNQEPKQDDNVRKRFFEIDHAQKWRMVDNNSSPNESCYVCQK